MIDEIRLEKNAQRFRGLSLDSLKIMAEELAKVKHANKELNKHPIPSSSDLKQWDIYTNEERRLAHKLRLAVASLVGACIGLGVVDDD